MGHWIIEEDILNRIHHCRCSKCNKDPQDYVEGTEDWWLGKLPNYCPHCGENMIIDDNKDNINKSSIRKIYNVQLCKYLETLYHTLREIKHRNFESFNSNEYKWKLGVEIADILKILDDKAVIQEKTQYLFGIEVEIDYENLCNIQLYEDITNKIALKLEF